MGNAGQYTVEKLDLFAVYLRFVLIPDGIHPLLLDSPMSFFLLGARYSKDWVKLHFFLEEANG